MVDGCESIQVEIMVASWGSCIRDFALAWKAWHRNIFCSAFDGKAEHHIEHILTQRHEFDHFIANMEANSAMAAADSSIKILSTDTEATLLE